MKVAINGVGIAGPALAYWLKRWGHEPVLFETAPALRTGGYLIDFWGLGYIVAERMGILDRLEAGGYEMQRMRMVGSRGEEKATVDLAPAREALDGRFISIGRSDLSRVLFEACDGVATHFGLSIEGIEGDAGAPIVRLSDGSRERFDVVVGADGLHSAVRALAFGPQAQFERFLGCYIAAFRTRGYPHRDELMHVSHTLQGRQIGRVSLRDDETLVLLVWRADPNDAEVPADRESRQRVIRAAFGDTGWEAPELLAALDHASDFYFDRVSQIRMPRWSTGPVVLVGDAAACPSLLAGEGSGLAMLEAYLLAGELHRSQGAVASAFAAYEDRLRTFVAAKQDSAIWLRGFFAPETALGLCVRDLAVHAMAIPIIAKPLLARTFRETLELPEYT
jgi:2-polyprenyl-6-methoxyphenol hydroxylase-like FAD-dependent oxidoreductase